MRDRNEQMLRWLGLFLAALILAEIVRAGCRANPFSRLRLPAVPTLQTNDVANAATNGTAHPSNSAGTGGVPTTNTATPAANTKTNGTAITNITAVANGTNRPVAGTNAAKVSTNTVTASATNAVAGSTISNSAVVSTNLSAGAINGLTVTNVVATGTTNSVAGTNQAAASTNAPRTEVASVPAHPHAPPGMPMGGMPFMGGGFPGMPGMGGPPAPLPKEIQARVDKIVDSEIFAPVNRPLPMQLIGIAGNTAFLRTDSGQSGLVKEGDSLGNVKLLRIGINRVLVEVDGEKKELMIFEGYGGESLMPK